MQLAAQCCHVKENLCSPVKRGVVSFRADTIDNRVTAYIKNIEIVDSRFPSLDAKEEDAGRLDSDGATGGPSSCRVGVKCALILLHDVGCNSSTASCLLMAGVNLKTVQELVGHQAIAVTARFAHLTPQHRQPKS